MSKRSTLKKTLVAAAVAAALGTAGGASAATLNMTWSGAFTMLNASGTPSSNSDAAAASPWWGWRTPITGTMSFNTTTGAGTGTVKPFSFFGSGLAKATNVTMQAIGNGSGGPGPLVLGNMSFNWNGNNLIPVSIVLDASGLFNAISNGVTPGEVISNTGVLPASNDTVFTLHTTTYTLPLGPTPVATTIWNTTNIGTVALGTNPSGTLPLITDTTVDLTNGDIGIGGSPMEAGPFGGYNANFDMTTLTVVPIPAAAWLFGSGLLGLVGIARRRRNKS